MFIVLGTYNFAYNANALEILCCSLDWIQLRIPNFAYTTSRILSPIIYIFPLSLTKQRFFFLSIILLNFYPLWMHWIDTKTNSVNIAGGKLENLGVLDN